MPPQSPLSHEGANPQTDNHSTGTQLQGSQEHREADSDRGNQGMDFGEEVTFGFQT